MDLEREKTYAYNQGLKEGVEKQAEESAKNLLKENISPEVIAKCVGLPLEKVLELQKLAQK